jgi:hypothetical protein
MRMTADAFLQLRPTTAFVVPLTTSGNVGREVIHQILDILAMITGMP